MTDGSHSDYVAAGYCASIDPYRAWCNGFNGHAGPHWARRMPNPDAVVSATNPTRVTWIGDYAWQFANPSMGRSVSAGAVAEPLDAGDTPGGEAA